MSNKKIKAKKQNHHDDCDDCRRQKQENAALISIYEKLQAIDNKSKTMRNSVDSHYKQCVKTRSKFGQFSNKFSSLPKQSKTNLQLERMGHQLAKQMMEDSLNGKVKKQNEKLKTILRRMQNNKKIGKFDYQLGEQISYKNKSAVFKDTYDHLKNPKSLSLSFKDTGTPPNIYSKQMEPDRTSIRYFGQVINQQEEQPNDTQTTGFMSTRNKNKFNTSNIDSLNLWLYNNDTNRSLEQALFQTKMPIIKYSKVEERRQKFLPEISSYSRKF